MPLRRCPRRRLASLATLPAAAAFAHAAHAQSARVIRTQSNVWLTTPTDVWITPSVGLLGEMLYERSAMATDPMQIVAGIGVQHMLRSGARVAIGTTLVHNSPYGPFPARAPYGEHRLWEQLQVDHRAGIVSLVHRYRLEQRWVERPNPTPGASSDIAYGVRVRYQLRGSVPVTKATVRHPRYVAASDELFVSFGPHAPLNLLDQNRAYLGAGVRWSPVVRAELGYLNQFVMRADGRQVENNNTLQLTLGFTRPASRKR